MLPTGHCRTVVYQHRIFYTTCVGTIYDATDVMVIYGHICVTMMMAYATHVRIAIHTTSVGMLTIV